MTSTMTLRDLCGVTVTLAAVTLSAALASAASAAEALPWQNEQAANDSYRPPSGYGSGGGYAPSGSGGYGGAYAPSAGQAGHNDAYNPNAGATTYYGANGAGANDAYNPGSEGAGGAYVPPGAPGAGAGGYGTYGAYGNGGGLPPSDPGYGQPYTEAPGSPPPVPPGEARASSSTFDQSEVIGAGHRFFGSISQSLAKAVEYAFQSQGRPNGYILGEDAGGAFVLGLRYGEGTLYTKNAGDHKVYWQGPSLGYDAGAEGSKTMVLVYNLTEPSDIYNRFGGVQGAAYVVGGVSVQFQKYNDVTLGVIRSGVGLRLGANIGYLKYTREPTWNPL
jgi:hypothetical protein